MTLDLRLSQSIQSAVDLLFLISMTKNKTLLDECHDILNEDDMTASHNLVDVMFNLLDVNQLNQLGDIITNQFGDSKQ